MEPWAKTCESCNKGQKPRWVGYFAGYNVIKKTTGLVEITATAAELLSAFAEKNGSIRGYLVYLARGGDRPNGPLLVQWEHANMDPQTIPKSFDVEAALFRLWGLHEHLRKPEIEVVSDNDPRLAGDKNADEFKMPANRIKDQLAHENGNGEQTVA